MHENLDRIILGLFEIISHQFRQVNLPAYRSYVIVVFITQPHMPTHSCKVA